MATKHEGVEEAKVVAGWLVLAIKGHPMPAVGTDQHKRLLHSIQTVYNAGLAGTGGKASAEVAMAALVALLEAVRQSGQAEQEAKGKKLN